MCGYTRLKESESAKYGNRIKDSKLIDSTSAVLTVLQGKSSNWAGQKKKPHRAVTGTVSTTSLWPGRFQLPGGTATVQQKRKKQKTFLQKQ